MRLPQQRAIVLPTLPAVLALIAPLWFASPAWAHSFEPGLLALTEHEPGVFDIRWKPPGAGAAALAAGASGLEPEFAAPCRRIEDSFGVARSDPLSGAEGASRWRIDCAPQGLHGGRIGMRGLAGTRVEVIVNVEWRDDSTTTGVLHSGAPVLTLPSAALGAASTSAVLWTYLPLGAEHILFGFDHLLFVLGLLLLVDTWSMLIKTISAFTVAHSLTLSLAVLGVVEVPPVPVEAAIALSIVLLAVELTRPAAAPTLCRRYPWAVAFTFGLLHGLGFAGALTAIGLPAGHIPLALLGFNVGVEVGQLAFILGMVGPVTLASRLVPAVSSARLVPAYVIGTLAVSWSIERILRFWTPVQ